MPERREIVPSTSDAELIRACRCGDAEAWESLVDTYGRLVQSIPLRLGLSSEDAADITQATFTIFLESLESFRDEGSLPAWLCTVARRQSWRVLGRLRRQVALNIDDIEDRQALHALGLADAGQMERWEVTLLVDQALRQLNAKCRELLLALYFDVTQPRYDEIARRFEMPVGSIGPTRARCLERLLSALSAQP